METEKENLMKTKVCNVCNIEKSESEYYKKGSGLQYRCKQCVKNHIRYEKCPNCDRQKRLEAELCSICSKQSQREVYSEELINQVIDLYTSGLSTWKIANQLGSYQVKIVRILHRNNIKLRNNDFVNNGKYREDNPAWKGYKLISGGYFASIKRSADSRNLEFDINIEYLNELFELQNGKCAISGLDIILPRSDESRSTGEYTASLDRKNSNLGYIKNNLQWVHKWVNKMKQNLQEDEFLYLCSLITDNNKDKIKEVDINTLMQYKRRNKIGT
jgi:hypothetical protein